jgi:hypothetical protein
MGKVVTEDAFTRPYPFTIDNRESPLQDPKEHEMRELLRIARMGMNPKGNEGWFERVKKVLGE